MWRISWSNSIIRWQDYRVAALRLDESNFRHTQQGECSYLCVPTGLGGTVGPVLPCGGAFVAFVGSRLPTVVEHVLVHTFRPCRSIPHVVRHSLKVTF